MSNDLGGQRRRPTVVVNKLEIEDDSERMRRIQLSLEKLNACPPGPRLVRPPQFNFGNMSTPPLIPPTELLSRVQAFLPVLESSNSLLARKAQADPDSVNIEHIEVTAEQYIEMNLGLGVFEQRSQTSPSASQQDARTSFSSVSSSSSASDSEGTSDSDASDSDSDDVEIITGFTPSRPIRPLPRRRFGRTGPSIVVVGQEERPEEP